MFRLDLRGAVDCGRNTHLILFERANNTSAINLKMDKSFFLKKNQLLRWWDSSSFLNWVKALTMVLLLKLPPRILKL